MCGGGGVYKPTVKITFNNELLIAMSFVFSCYTLSWGDPMQLDEALTPQNQSTFLYQTNLPPVSDPESVMKASPQQGTSSGWGRRRTGPWRQ